MDISEYVNRTENESAKVDALRITSPQRMGGLVWIHHNAPWRRFSNHQDSRGDRKCFPFNIRRNQFGASVKKNVRYLKPHRRKFNYIPQRVEETRIVRSDDLKRCRVISFPDAGFAKLQGDCVVEANLIAFGGVLYRDGEIRCHCIAFDHRRAKIQRVCLLSLSAEARGGDGRRLRELIPNSTHWIDYSSIQRPEITPSARLASD